LPLIKKLTIGINTARFTRTLGILTGSGVPILKALKISSQVVTNMPMRGAIEVSATRVEEGEMISRSLAISQLFPIMAIHLIASGEASGNLDEMLLRAAKNQEKEVDNLISTLIGIMQPLLVIIMAIIVLLIVLAILLPIFEINNLIS
jgi:general secretion pathway protein F